MKIGSAGVTANRKFALTILIGNCGRMHFQLRDDKPGIHFPGMVGLFGGQREGRESLLECAQRELHEETGIAVSREAFQPLLEYQTRYPDGARVKAAFFVVRGAASDRIVVTEGRLLSVPPRDVPSIMGCMTPSTCFAVRTFFSLDRGRD